MTLVRVREHVNPLSRKYQVAATPPVWPTAFADPTQPLHLDIGCGRGKFLLEMAQQAPDWNFLGLEIREPLVDQANEWRSQLQITNLFYLFCNANTSLQPLLASLPSGVLQRVTIQFPDPWFKRRHQKRRVVQPELVTNVAEFLGDGGMVFLQSDIEEVAVEMRNRFAEHPAFQRSSDQWLEVNPLPVQTERELLVLSFHDPVYRTVFLKSAATSSR